MIENTVMEHLAAALEAPVLMEVPATPAERFAVVEKTGSGRENHICTATVAVQAYGRTMLEAAQLNERVKAAMEDLDALEGICSCRLNSDYNFTDTASKRYRYQAVFNIAHY